MSIIAGVSCADVECSLDSVKQIRAELESQVLKLQSYSKELEDSVSEQQGKSSLADERNRHLVSQFLEDRGIVVVVFVFCIDRK